MARLHIIHWSLSFLLIGVSTSSFSTPPTLYWHPLPTSLPPNADVEAVAINPAMPATLYAGTFAEGVYRSNDNGATWVTATTGLTRPMSVQNAAGVSNGWVADVTDSARPIRYIRYNIRCQR